jgi:hypothetical protein
VPDSEVTKYLNKYSIKGYDIVWNSGNEITSAVVIPAIKEFENLKTLLQSLKNNESTYFKNTLFVFVINNLPSSDQSIKEDNKKSLELINNIVNKSFSDKFIKEILDSGLIIGYINASSSGKELPEKTGGVGLARKIGMDAALTLFNYKDIKRKKILICLDADCTVKTNYLTEIHRHFYENDLDAASIYFEHLLTHREDEDLAIICYEIFLRYYVMCLKYAGSCYAFHTVGSSMACDHHIYIKTEGMNKKKAAEDFYFLEKISKHTRICKIISTAVYPSARKSWRVPFGTGQRVTRYYAKTHPEYFLYNPDILEILKKWLIVFHSGDILSPEKYLIEAKGLSKGLYEFLKLQNFEPDFASILNSSKSPEQIKMQQFRWFDGFRTLKLIHFLRDNGYPNINMFEALDIMLFKCKVSLPKYQHEEIPEKKVQLKYLEKLRFLDKNL